MSDPHVLRPCTIASCKNAARYFVEYDDSMDSGNTIIRKGFCIEHASGWMKDEIAMTPSLPAVSERERFEHWVKSCDGEFTDWSRDKTSESNPYHKPRVEIAWQAWKAALSAAFQVRASHVEKEWNAAIEAAAKHVEALYLNPASIESPQKTLAASIRSLARPQPPAADSQQATEQGWQKIETAPKDGTTIFGRNEKMAQRGLVYFNSDGRWEMVDGLTNFPAQKFFEPTHWVHDPSRIFAIDYRAAAPQQSKGEAG